MITLNLSERAMEHTPGKTPQADTRSDARTEEWEPIRARDTKRWTTIAGFIVAVAAATLAGAELKQQLDGKASKEEVAVLKAQTDAAFRLLCVMAKPDERALSGVACPNPYR